MNKRGFTLLELIVVMIILGSIMLLSLPNISSMIDKNRRTAYINDAKKMIKLSRYKFNLASEGKPAELYCKLYTLADLDRSELDVPPQGGTYDASLSYVYVKYNKTSATYEYHVQLLEKYKVGTKYYYRGIISTLEENLNYENSKMKYVTNPYETNAYFTRNLTCTTI